jgi:hypothetical protein
VSDQDLVLAAVEEAHRALSTSIQAQGGTQRPPSTCFFSCWTGATLWLLNAQVNDSHSSRRGNRYLRVLFVQAAWVVLVRIKNWERYGLKSWIEAAKRRLHHNVLAIALANKLARIAWACWLKDAPSS